MYAAANDILGRIPKVTPSSKVIGDLALALVAAGADPRAFADDPSSYDIPASVIGFLHGELGDPPGGWPEPFRTKATEGRPWTAPAEELAAEDEAALRDDDRATRRHTLNRLLFPGPTREFAEACSKWGDVSILPTVEFLYGLRFGEEHVVELEEGKQLYLGVEAISEPDERGYRTVMCTINGQMRPIAVRDRSVEAEAAAAEKADPSIPGQVAAPFQGVVTIAVSVGDKVAAGDTVATIEAMKMEAAITAPVSGTVERLPLSGTQAVDGGDLVLVLR
jgi:pyruvate carboxylase